MTTHRSVTYALAALFALAFLAHAASFLDFFYDDSFISLRYADRLLHGHGLTWSDGERVEGYSDLLWVLLCAGLGALGIDLVDAARALGVISALATFAAVVRSGQQTRAGTLLALAFLAGSGSLAVWAIAGLEATLLGALIAWGTTWLLTSSERAHVEARWLRASGVAFALAALTRPDGVLFASGGLALIVAESPRTALPARLRDFARPIALAVLGQLAFRWLYYGDVVPNSAHVKLALTATRALYGARYLGTGLLESAGLVVLGVVALVVVWRRRERRALAIAVPLAIWCAYLITIGGDPIPARRHFVPIVVLLALAVVEGARTVGAPGWRVSTGALACLAAFVGAQILAVDYTEVRGEHWEWRGRTLGLVLRHAFEDQAPLVAVDPAGCVPYYSGLPSLDMLGLNDRHIGSAPVRDFGDGPIGHERGDGAYVLARHPDLVLFCGPDGARSACFRSGREMERDPRFERDYRPIVIVNDAPALRSQLYARLESETIGIRTSPSEVVIPAYFFSRETLHFAAPAADGALVLRLAAEWPATLHRVPMPARGTWTADAIPGVTIEVPSVYPTPEGLRADVTIRATHDVELRTITLRH